MEFKNYINKTIYGILGKVHKNPCVNYALLRINMADKLTCATTLNGSPPCGVWIKLVKIVMWCIKVKLSLWLIN